VKCSPGPIFLKRNDLGNEICQVLLSSSQVLAVPPILDDIAASLTWLLLEAPFPLSTSYADVAINLQYACDSEDDFIHPLEAHFKIAVFAMSNLMRAFSPENDVIAMAILRPYLCNRWGQSISLVGFQTVLCDSYEYLINVSLIFLF
jgi:hypothetical protein